MKVIKLAAIVFGVMWMVNLCSAQGLVGERVYGTIKDSETGLPLEGANVVLFGTNIGSTSNSKGEYSLRDVPVGKYILSVSFLGYKIGKKEIEVRTVGTLMQDFQLAPIVLKGQEVIITAGRAKVRETPVAFSNISRKELKQDYWAQDIPMLLTIVPNVYAYSDAGNGIGYSYLKIRGFDQKRISVMINGIPHNDPRNTACIG